MAANQRIAREGETEFAAIKRNRSGQDSGRIDYGIAILEVESLSDGEKAELCTVSSMMHESILRRCGKVPATDTGWSHAAIALERMWPNLFHEGFDTDKAAEVIRMVLSGRLSMLR